MPLFILLGEILLRSGFAERMYARARQLGVVAARRPDAFQHRRLRDVRRHLGIERRHRGHGRRRSRCGEAKHFGYNERIFLGTLAAGGTLGILIPPSINMIIYGGADQFVGAEALSRRLYSRIGAHGAVQPGRADRLPVAARLGRPQRPDELARAARTLPDLVPPLVLFMLVVGSIYVGIATPTESAAVGVVGALALTAWRRRSSSRMLRDVFEATVHTTAMVVAILVGAFFLNVVIQTIGLTQQLSELITQYRLTPVQVLSAVIVLYVVLGTFMEELSMMISTIPITTPLVVQAGYDPVWFGVLIVLPDPDGDGDAALRHQPVRHSWHPWPWPVDRRRARLGAVRRGPADHDRHDLPVARHRDAPAALVRVTLSCRDRGPPGQLMIHEAGLEARGPAER